MVELLRKGLVLNGSDFKLDPPLMEVVGHHFSGELSLLGRKVPSGTVALETRNRSAFGTLEAYFLGCHVRVV
jgi:hypothetical protein